MYLYAELLKISWDDVIRHDIVPRNCELSFALLLYCKTYISSPYVVIPYQLNIFIVKVGLAVNEMDNVL
jgi:hypothetical protein